MLKKLETKMLCCMEVFKNPNRDWVEKCYWPKSQALMLTLSDRLIHLIAVLCQRHVPHDRATTSRKIIHVAIRMRIGEKASEPAGRPMMEGHDALADMIVD